MIRTRIAQRYARALFELARDAGQAEEIRGELLSLQELLASQEDLRVALLSPAYTRAVKAEILEALVQATSPHPLVANFLRVLLAARKLPLLPDVASAYSGMADEAAGRVRGEAVTLMPLGAEEVQALSDVLSRVLEKDVELSPRLDPSLLGGVVVRVGNLFFDGSLRTQLLRMRENLIKG